MNEPIVKPTETDEDVGRRGFFKAAVRGTALGAMALVGGLLAVKRARAPASQTCINDSLCKACPIVDKDCVLPQAMSFRHVRDQLKKG